MKDNQVISRRIAAQVSPTVLALSVTDACHMLSIGRTKIYALLASGELKSFMIGGRRLIARVDLEGLVENARNAA